VAADEREHGRRKVLNFGHTVGHGVEAASSYAMLHGEAIAVGMVAEAQLAEQVGIADAGTASGVERAVVAAGLPARLPVGLEPDRILALMSADKKRRHDALEYSLPRRIGVMAGADRGWAVAVPDADVRRVLHALA
jgi:3-dehydroquinate synthase